jgi:hypothetical protein
MKHICFPILFICLIQSGALAVQKPDIHDTWNQILTTYVHDGVVNYRGLKGNQTAQQKLSTYLDSLGKADISAFSKEDLLAFWINTYNAFTVKLILDHYPVRSIKDIPNAWEQKSWRVAGQLMSLNDIENIKLRKELHDPRIHFAIVCASKGCPDMQNRAYRADAVNQLLDDTARSFFRQQKNFQIEKSSNTLILKLSHIFQWYGADFGKTDKELIAFMLPFLPKETAEVITQAQKVELKYIEYDWSLNGT